MLLAFLIGIALGAGTGIIPGPVGLAVIDTTYRRGLPRALAIGAGGGLGDLTWATLGVLGVGPLLRRHPAAPPVLFAVSGAALIVYGLSHVRGRPADDAPPPPRPLTGGVTLGLLLVLMNPSTLVTWVVIVGALTAHLSPLAGVALLLGIGVGSAGWSAVLAVATQRGKQLLGESTVWLPRAVGALLIAYGTFSLARAAYCWLS